MAQDYNSTLNLPQTEFSMRGNLTQKEPAMLESWEKDETYYEMVKKNEGRPRFILHDGPPYANGDVHMGITPVGILTVCQLSLRLLKRSVLRTEQFLPLNSESTAWSML